MNDKVLEKRVLIGGNWVESESKERLEVYCPGNNRVLGTVPYCTREDARQAIAAAKEGQKSLANLSLIKRIELLKKAVSIASKKDEDASRILCMESGKVMRQSISEASPLTGYSWSNFHIAMANVKTHRGLTLPNVSEDSNDKRIMHVYEPVGVVVNLSTFSFPSEMPNCSIPYALALGNAVIVKPSSGAPFSAILIAEALHEAGFPPGSVNVLTGPGNEVGDELVSHQGTDAINFFGQEKTGATIAARAAMKKQLFIIGSNCALVVMDDANIDEAVSAAVSGCYSTNGQSPVSTGRILIHQDVYNKFLDRFVDRTKNLVFGNPLDLKTEVGPVNNKKVLGMTIELMEDACKNGGRILTGGNDPDGLYLEPTVIENVSKEMKIFQEPILGPVVSVMSFNSIDEAVELANSTRFGFQVGAFTSSLANAYYLAENIQAGSVLINEATNYFDKMSPFGGVKRSGVGRLLSNWILDELSEIKMILFDLNKVKRQ